MAKEEAEPLGRRRVEAIFASKRAVAAVAEEVNTDPDKREEFLRDPDAFLRNAGVDLPEHVELTDRDRDLLRIVSDPDFADIYEAGDVTRLKDHLRENYPSLVPDASKVAWTVSDFEVAVEAVVVAVGVAFVPL